MNTNDWIALDLRHIWHPFTHHGLWGGPEDPVVVIERAEHNTLIDTDGRRYLDAISSLWCNTLGHRVPAIDDAIRAQIDRVAHSTLLGLSSKPAIELAAKLATLAPGDLDRVFYSDSGATSVEIALKISAQLAQLVEGPHTRRRKFATLGLAYHGDTLGAVSLGFTDWFHGAFAHLTFDVLKLPSPDLARREWGESESSYAKRVTEEAVSLIEAHGEELCAVVLEPIMQGAAGMIAQPTGFLKAIAQATARAGALLVCDEVATGFWRTGTRFACEQENVIPDLLCMAKGLTAGYLPLAATVVRPRVFEPFSRGGSDGSATFFHGHTYTGNALACSAALAGIAELEKLAASGRIAQMIDRMHSLLLPLRDHEHVLEVRQRGLMAGVELVLDRERRIPYPREARIGHHVAHEARRRGVLLRPLGPVMVLMPPFSFSDEELDFTVSVLRESIVSVTRRGD